MGFTVFEQGSRGVQTSCNEPRFPKNTSFKTIRAANASVDRTHKCMQYAGLAGLENMSVVTGYVAG